MWGAEDRSREFNAVEIPGDTAQSQTWQSLAFGNGVLSKGISVLVARPDVARIYLPDYFAISAPPGEQAHVARRGRLQNITRCPTGDGTAQP